MLYVNTISSYLFGLNSLFFAFVDSTLIHTHTHKFRQSKVNSTIFNFFKVITVKVVEILIAFENNSREGLEDGKRGSENLIGMVIEKKTY